MSLLKPLAAGLAIALAATSFTTSAEARHRYYQHGYHHGGGFHHGGAFAAGAAGFAAGALFSAFAQPRYYYDDYPPVYYQPRYYGPAPVYVAPQPRAYYQQPAYGYQRPANTYGACSTAGGVSRPANSLC